MRHTLERKSFEVIINGLYDYVNRQEDKRKTYLKLANAAEKFYGKGVTPETMAKVKERIRDPEDRWMKFIDKIIDETDSRYAKTMLLDLGYESFLRGTRQIRRNREKYNCNIPWLILFDPTSACNMHCTGCWSGTYGHKNNLSFEAMDKIVSQGKALGTHLYMMTGGEPLVRKKDILRLCKKHRDCFFAAYTNSTLIDEELCRKVVELGNLTFMISIEGSEKTNDGRRGEGHYAAAMKAMDLLKKYGIVYGTSICYTRQNIEAVTSDEFLRFIASKGARFGFYFHYMPIGNNAVPELLPTVEQRKKMIERIRYVRSDACDIEFFPMDFQNDGEYVGGCIAGGRNYFHINSRGDAEPCVFIHFSDRNIHKHSVLEMLKGPLFMEYHKGQPFNRNHLRPCPMLENPQLLREMIERTKAVQTNEESAESAEHLCAKCDRYAEEWADVAEKIWDSQTHKKPAYENYSEEKRRNPELAAFETMPDKAS